jgi:hypothetical protein
MHLADRCFPALRAKPRFVETLLFPFQRNVAERTKALAQTNLALQKEIEERNALKLNSDAVKPIWRKASGSATPGAGPGTLFRASSMVGRTQRPGREMPGKERLVVKSRSSGRGCSVLGEFQALDRREERGAGAGVAQELR